MIDFSVAAPPSSSASATTTTGRVWQTGGKQQIPGHVSASLNNHEHLEAIHDHLRYIYDRLDDLLDRVHNLERAQGGGLRY